MLNEGDRAKIEQVNQYIKKQMRFYNKNYEELNEASNNRFDNVTFKTVKSKFKYEQDMIVDFKRNFSGAKIDTQYLV